MFRTSGYWFAALFVASVFAFWPRYLSRLGEGIDGYTHFHAAVVPLVHLGWFTLAQGRAWRCFAEWFRALPLT